MNKHLLTLGAALLLCGSISAQEPQVLFTDSFEDYTVGNHLASEAIAAGNTWWTTWDGNSAAGTAEDGIISDAQASDGTLSAHMTFGNDQVLLLGDEQNGIYDIEFDILVPSGKNGYFNILHKFNGANSTWAMQCYLHMTNNGSTSTVSPGHGTIHAGGNNVADVPCVFDGWMHFRLHVDTDHDVAEYYYTLPGESEQLAYTWQWSLDSFGNNVVGRQLAAIDFYPPKDASTSEFYIDNISYTKTSGATAPSFSVDIDSIVKSLSLNEMDIVDFTISNDGTSIADYLAYIDFGEGTVSSQTATLNYYDPSATNVSVVSFKTDEGVDRVNIEAGAMFPASYYGGAIMGTHITKARIYLGTASTSGDTIPIIEGEPLVFRVYGPGLYNQPGELLAEKAMPYNDIVIGEFNEVTFDEPVVVRGFNFWVTAEYVQRERMYPLAFDGGQCDANGAYYRSGGYEGGAIFVSAADSDYGNILIDITCEGDPIQGAWATLQKTEGSIMIEESDVMLVSINSIGLTDNTTYTADLIFRTNDTENEEVIIPIKLIVGDDGVIESVKAIMAIYPNPSNGQFTINGSNLSHADIYNTVGQLVEKVTLNSGSNSIRLNAESGIYFISIFDNNGNNTVERLVIK